MKLLLRRIKQLKVIILLCCAHMTVFLFHRDYLMRDIWLIGEKTSEARDNGYHFFRYLCTKHPEVTAVYAIAQNAPDAKKVKALGETVDYDSFRHLCYYVAAKFRICGQAYGVQPFVGIVPDRRLRQFCRKGQKSIFIGHGIKNNCLPTYDYRLEGYDLLTTGAKPEYTYIKETFHYPDEKIAFTGLCRYDALHGFQTEKVVLVMPTFRTWLRTDDSTKERASEQEARRFLQSDYFNYYVRLLSDTELSQALKANGYKLLFYLHYTFQPFRFLFEEKLEGMESVVIAGRDEYDVQDLLKRASLMITDYSSVFFDFAYMKKPLAYFQFDEELFRGKHYKEGYFSYKRDGFGPVFDTVEDVVAYIKNAIIKEPVMEKLYADRSTSFFEANDSGNCERLYNTLQAKGW